MDLITLRENESAFDRYKIRPRILINVDKMDTSIEIFGTKVSFPLGFSPAASQKLAHPDGELAASRAAAKYKVGMGLSSHSNYSLEDMCVLKDSSVTLQLLERAEKSGYKALFLWVDVPLLGKRLNEYRNNYTLPEDMTWPNILSHGKDTSNRTNYDPSLEWETTIPWLRKLTRLQIWLKGVYTPEDVELAIQYGVDGVVISNHGGRQLDGVPATLDALRECAPVAQGRIPLAIDGGIRMEAVALGASQCFVGRIPIWGLAWDGQEGVELAIKILLQEFRITMALAGCKSVKDIRKSHLSILKLDGVLSKL
ncbi:FMN-dependent dehydrogenase [Aspergillus leporis]|uniref:FMN-dependent dehydrogenase n=1 Tax=Aspergillus leporis TaxID=41062 RepID=A0A5N5WLC2_9EURO|nr:FMN-dependent dehydrogenase [Aspergillus leporis]